MVPVIGRMDLLRTCLRSLRAGDQVLIVDNTTIREATPLAKKYGARIMHPQRNLGVAGSWNAGLTEEHAALTIFCSAAIEVTQPGGAAAWLDRHFGDLPASTPGFVVPAPVGFHFWGVTRSTVVRVGSFDQRFWPAYCEDTDYRRRMRLAGLELYETPLEGVRVNEIGHGAHLLGLRGDENDAYFMRKWGCTPQQAHDIDVGYVLPFNGRHGR